MKTMQTPQKLTASLRHNIGPPLLFVVWLYVAAQAPQFVVPAPGMATEVRVRKPEPSAQPGKPVAQTLAGAGVQKSTGNVSDSAVRHASLE